MILVFVSLAVVAVVLVGFAVLIWSAQPKDSAHRWFAFFTFLVGSWSLGIAQLYGGVSGDFWARFTFAACSLMPPAFLGFIRSYPATRGSVDALVIIAACMGAGLSILSVTTPFIVASAEVRAGELIRKVGPLYPVFVTYFISYWVISMIQLGAHWRRARGTERLKLQYLLSAIAFCLSGAVITNLVIPVGTGRSTHSWIGPYFGVIFIAVIGHAIIRPRLIDLRLVVYRGLTFVIAVALSLTPVIVVGLLFWPHLETHFTPNEVVLGLITITGVALLIPITRDVTARAFDRCIYRRRTNYQRTLREASRGLTKVLDLRRLQHFLQTNVAQAADCEGIAVYFKRANELRRATVERQPDSDFDAPPDFPDDAFRLLQESRDIIVVEQLRRKHSNRSLHLQLSSLNWTLILPTVSDDHVIGAIALGPKRSGDPYYPQDVNLLMTLANQAGIAIKNAQLYAQVVLANEYLENIVATIPSGVVAVDGEGTVTMFNRAAEELMGVTLAEAQGATMTALPAGLGNTLQATLADGFARTEPEIDLFDGHTTRPVMCTTSPLRDPDGTLLGAVAVFSDLTPVRELELERRRAERLAYLETFASGIAHEVKNPLVAIKTFVQLIPRRREDERFVEEFSRVVGREIGRMERLVDRLRTLSRPGQRPRTLLDVRQPLVDALEFIQAGCEEKNLHVEAALGETEAPVLGDGNELEQLFLNLLMNAQEATPRGGRIGVAVSSADGRVCVAVTDTGPGIPAEALSRVFEPFFTTKERGSGLGLAICAGIADSHGARVRAENPSAGGARFTVEFPLASEVSVPVTS